MNTCATIEAVEATDVSDLEPLPVQSENVIQFPLGILGFEKIKRFALLESPQELPFRWLQVIDQPNLAFLVLPATQFLPSYQPDVPADDVKFLGISQPEDALLFNIVTLRSGGVSTVNLKGPVVINRFTLKAKQVVLANAAEYSVQHPLTKTI
jgi:flagellar assembly factor FliW